MRLVCASFPPTHLTIDYGIVGHPERIREIKRTCERTGVGVLDIEVVTLNAETDVARLLPALETSPRSAHSSFRRLRRSRRTRAADRFAALCDAAGRFGLRVSLEFMRFPQLAHPRGRVALWWKRPGAPTAAFSSMRCISLDRVERRRQWRRCRRGALRTCNCATGPRSRRRSKSSRTNRATNGRWPGEGEFPLDELFDALPDEIPSASRFRAPSMRRCMKERAVLGRVEATRAWLASTARGAHEERAHHGRRQRHRRRSWPRVRHDAGYRVGVP
jgi:hypothetical protein